MKISQEGLSLIKKFEGCPTDEEGNVVSYRCAANVPTIGYGSTKYKGEPAEKQKLCYLKAKNGMRFKYALTETYI
jgi:GH24 family phage-related lysozyme (muramidase)